MVADTLQNCGRQAANGIFVFHEENGLSRARSSAYGLGLRRLHFLIDARKKDLERCALRRRTVERQIAASLIHNPVDGRQSKAGSFSPFLRREKRFEDKTLDVVGYSRAVIGD